MMPRRLSRAAYALLATLLACAEEDSPVLLEPVVVESPLLLPGIIVQGALKSSKTSKTSKTSNTSANAQTLLVAEASSGYGKPVRVEITAYCLTRTQTRRGRYVRAGIVATDPKLFPLSRYLELYAGRRYLGRFLIDDTGRLIKGNRIDVWMPTCREAQNFGRRKGMAVLVPREPAVELAGRPRAP